MMALRSARSAPLRVISRSRASRFTRTQPVYSERSEAMSIENRYFTSDLTNLS